MRKAWVVLVPLLVAVVSGCSSSTVTLVDHASGQTSPAHVGDTLDLTTLSGKHFTVTLTQVVDPAQGAKGATAGSGKRFVAPVFRITNTSDQQLQGDIGADTVVISSTGDQYQHARVALEDCSGSDSAQFSVAAGQSKTLCAAFKLHTSVTVAKVQFLPTSGAANDYGQWLVP